MIFRLFLTLYPRLKNEFDFNSQFFRRSFRYCVILCLLGYLFNFNKSIVQVSIRIMRGQHVINFLNCTEGQTNEIKKLALSLEKAQGYLIFENINFRVKLKLPLHCA